MMNTVFSAIGKGMAVYFQQKALCVAGEELRSALKSSWYVPETVIDEETGEEKENGSFMANEHDEGFIREEHLQDALLKGIEEIREGLIIHDAKQWLKTVCFRCANDDYKNRITSKAVSLSSPDIAQHVESIPAVAKRNRRAFLKRHLQLKPAMKRILEMYLDGFTFEEIDVKLGKKPGYAQKGTIRLRQALSRHGEEFRLLNEGLKELNPEITGKYTVYSSQGNEPLFEPDKEEMSPYIPVESRVSDSVSPFFGSGKVKDDIPRVNDSMGNLAGYINNRDARETARELSCILSEYIPLHDEDVRRKP